MDFPTGSARRAVLIALALGLAGCQQNSQGGFTPPLLSPDVFSAAYVTDWSVHESAAAWLRGLPEYAVQNFSTSLAPVPHFSIVNARAEYAHAAGLSGAGQIISIVDDGFLASHVEFSGKSIRTPGNAPLPVEDHGTMVASIAAGAAGSGRMIGIAPGADLQLGDFSSFTTAASATRQAESLGAVVQNNSWGFPWEVSRANYDSLFGAGSGADYLGALRSFGRNAVIVFAASNDTTLAKADIMAALPLLEPALEDSWITVVNATPTRSEPDYSSNTIVSATLLSSRCLEAARWCMVADGTIYAATAAGPDAYDYGTGTSFAAPQVAGAIALLAQAFPELGPKELRARLLASADNGFYPHTGYVEFAPGIRHGYDTTFGHGFLNLKAALAPIGGSYLARSNGQRLPFQAPILLSGGPSGDSLSRALSGRALILSDGLGAAFRQPATILGARAMPRPDPQQGLQSLRAVTLDSPGSGPFRARRAFPVFSPGQELDFEAGATRVSVLAPAGGSGNWGLALSRGFGFGTGRLRLGIAALHEADGFAGLRSLLPEEPLGGRHAIASLQWSVPLGRAQSFGLSGRIGRAFPEGRPNGIELETVIHDALALDYDRRDLFRRGDRLALGISLPQAVRSGTARLALPVALRSDGTPAFAAVDIPLAPRQRQVDLSLAYGMPLARGGDFLFSLTRQLNGGNIAGNDSTETAFMFRFRF